MILLSYAESIFWFGWKPSFCLIEEEKKSAQTKMERVCLLTAMFNALIISMDFASVYETQT